MAAAATHSHKFSKLIFLSARHVSHSTFVIISTLARAADESGVGWFWCSRTPRHAFCFCRQPLSVMAAAAAAVEFCEEICFRARGNAAAAVSLKDLHFVI